ncbi:MAG: cyanophycin synthetase, partial [Candidatus Neomarinimicrobiota bacterium]
HVAHLEDQAGVIREKEALFKALPADGAAMVNFDDPAIAGMETPARRIIFSSRSNAHFTGRYKDAYPGGTLVLDDGLEIHLSQPGAHLAQNALAAFALGVHLNVPREDIKAALEAFVPPAGRGELLRLDGITVIDDSYNANLASTLAGLDTLLQVPATGRRIVVLGDMLELGRFSQEHHRQVGAFAASHGIDALLCYGPETRETYCTALDGGVDARHFTERSELAHVLSESVAAGDVVYVKGSRGMAMESVISEAFPR